MQPSGQGVDEEIESEESDDDGVSSSDSDTPSSRKKSTHRRSSAHRRSSSSRRKRKKKKRKKSSTSSSSKTKKERREHRRLRKERRRERRKKRRRRAASNVNASVNDDENEPNDDEKNSDSPPSTTTNRTRTRSSGSPLKQVKQSQSDSADDDDVKKELPSSHGSTHELASTPAPTIDEGRGSEAEREIDSMGQEEEDSESSEEEEIEEGSIEHLLTMAEIEPIVKAESEENEVPGSTPSFLGSKIRSRAFACVGLDADGRRKAQKRLPMKLKKRWLRTPDTEVKKTGFTSAGEVVLHARRIPVASLELFLQNEIVGKVRVVSSLPVKRVLRFTRIEFANLDLFDMTILAPVDDRARESLDRFMREFQARNVAPVVLFSEYLLLLLPFRFAGYLQNMDLPSTVTPSRGFVFGLLLRQIDDVLLKSPFLRPIPRKAPRAAASETKTDDVPGTPSSAATPSTPVNHFPPGEAQQGTTLQQPPALQQLAGIPQQLGVANGLVSGVQTPSDPVAVSSPYVLSAGTPEGHVQPGGMFVPLQQSSQQLQPQTTVMTRPGSAMQSGMIGLPGQQMYQMVPQQGQVPQSYAPLPVPQSQIVPEQQIAAPRDTLVPRPNVQLPKSDGLRSSSGLPQPGARVMTPVDSYIRPQPPSGVPSPGPGPLPVPVPGSGYSRPNPSQPHAQAQSHPYRPKPEPFMESRGPTRHSSSPATDGNRFREPRGGRAPPRRDSSPGRRPWRGSPRRERFRDGFDRRSFDRDGPAPRKRKRETVSPYGRPFDPDTRPPLKRRRLSPRSSEFDGRRVVLGPPRDRRGPPLMRRVEIRPRAPNRVDPNLQRPPLPPQLLRHSESPGERSRGDSNARSASPASDSRGSRSPTPLLRRSSPDPSSGSNERTVRIIPNPAAAAVPAGRPNGAKRVWDRSVPQKTLWCGRLRNPSESDMRSYFSTFGEVASVRVIAHRRYGFVEFHKLEDAVRAKQKVDHSRYPTVCFHQPRD